MQAHDSRPASLGPRELPSLHGSSGSCQYFNAARQMYLYKGNDHFMQRILSNQSAIRRFALRSTFGGAAAILLTSMPAHACSDLPNICAQNARHHQEMMDIAATAPRGEDERADAGYEASAAGDPMAAAMAAMSDVSRSAGMSAQEIEARKRDPKFRAAYERYHNGGWDNLQDGDSPEPGEYCVALYSKGDVMLRISGPGGDYRGALMTFSGGKITGSQDVRKIKVTLNQSDGSSQTVRAFNYQLPGEAYGSIAFAVPTIEAAMAEMNERQGFEVLVSGQSVARLDWSGGLAARRKLEQCLAKRKKA